MIDRFAPLDNIYLVFRRYSTNSTTPMRPFVSTLIGRSVGRSVSNIFIYIITGENRLVTIGKNWNL